MIYYTSRRPIIFKRCRITNGINTKQMRPIFNRSDNVFKTSLFATWVTSQVWHLADSTQIRCRPRSWVLTSSTVLVLLQVVLGYKVSVGQLVRLSVSSLDNILGATTKPRQDFALPDGQSFLNFVGLLLASIPNKYDLYWTDPGIFLKVTFCDVSDVTSVTSGRFVTRFWTVLPIWYYCKWFCVIKCNFYPVHCHFLYNLWINQTSRRPIIPHLYYQ